MEQISQVRIWQAERKHLGPRQQRLVKVGPFQDDHAIITVTPGKHVLEKCRQLLHDKLKVEISPKPEANEPLDTRFTAIGAAYDTTGHDGITFKPKDSITAKHKAITTEAR